LKDEPEILRTLGVFGAEEIETAFGPMIPLRSIRTAAPAAPSTDLAQSGGNNQMQRETLSEAEKKIIASLPSVSEAGYLRQKQRGGAGQAFAAAEQRGTAGLLRAHQEIDRAQKATYAAAGDHGDVWENVPDGQLLSKAISELQAYKPGDEATYDNLLRGVLHAACLLDRNAPAFADTKDFKP
jgi:hypothetical protein